MSENDSVSSSHALLTNLRSTIINATSEVLWRQWSAVGGAASARARAQTLVDPESLVLMSLTLAPSEPRLEDVVSDWTALNADVLSVQRMRNLASRYPRSTQAHLAALARVAVEEAKDHRWKPLLGQEAAPTVRRRNKRRAVRVPASEAAALMLRLRLAFGVGIKADLLTFLLCTHDTAATISAIAGVTDYTPAAVRKAVRDLAEAGFVRSVIQAGTVGTFRYRTVRTTWSSLVPRTPPWIDWKARFIFVADVLDWSEAASSRPVTQYVFESALRDRVERNAAAFEFGMFDFGYPPAPLAKVERFAEAMVAEA